ncbi:hypothetical protein Moror_6080 [Moniliophthora roreri MCA 2997]|uniref:FAD-binding domain-containing protein n=2 Tax=Moniliophthora roreri TaxID=221103 RepID=V2W8D1_MONRO|nr:hypothetical protein Moror_6080 [Moniliophthora roreri MCA 2997]KAI3607513.1 hypothetical protein WG66_004596 [Moniliophthora roreri]
MQINEPTTLHDRHSTTEAGLGESVPLYGGRKAKERLKILIVGCGLGGLAAAYCLGQAGHDIVVLESSPVLGEIGAGIQICPNLSRLLIRWGLGHTLQQLTQNDQPKAFTYVRYDTGELVGLAMLGDKMVRDHGAPWQVIHRQELQKMLLTVAKPFMNLKLGVKVISVDPDTPSVTLASGATISGDFIIGADGIHSIVRQSVIGESAIPLSVPLGDVAFRALIPTSTMMDDPELRDLVENPRLTCWMGPSRHVMGYRVRNGKEYNMVLIAPDDGSTYSWTAEGRIEEVREKFSGWEPRFLKLIDRMPRVLKSKLIIPAPLTTWLHSAAKVTLLGDACHPILPYRAQGAAMAIEDAAVLGNLFSRLSDKSQMPKFLKVYEDIRLARVSSMQKGALDNRTLYHMPDGPEQDARDASMRLAMQKSINESLSESTSINPWADKSKLASSFSYDVDAVTDDWCDSHGFEMTSRL